jgi:hypothetical protein
MATIHRAAKFRRLLSLFNQIGVKYLLVECARRVTANANGVRTAMISFEDLKANKRASGRYQDLADLLSLP